MTCPTCKAWLSAYLDGELSGQQMAALRSHLGACRTCSRELDVLRSIKHAVGCELDCDPAPGFEERLVMHVMGSGASSAVGKRSIFTPLAGWLTATAVAAAVFVGILTLRSARLEHEHQTASNSSSFELARDQAYVAGSEPMGGGAILPASYGRR